MGVRTLPKLLVSAEVLLLYWYGRLTKVSIKGEFTQAMVKKLIHGVQVSKCATHAMNDTAKSRRLDAWMRYNVLLTGFSHSKLQYRLLSLRCRKSSVELNARWPSEISLALAICGNATTTLRCLGHLTKHKIWYGMRRDNKIQMRCMITVPMKGVQGLF